MRLHHVVALLWLLALVTGCASGRVVRLETGRGAPVVLTPAPMTSSRWSWKAASSRGPSPNWREA
jgi:hypothetical protein